jgi:hypothetical protein
MFPRVKEIIHAFEKGGLENVKLYFNQKEMQIDPSTWCGNIKKSIDDGYSLAVIAEIKLLKEKFNFYKNVSKEKNNNTRTGTVNKK